MGGGPGRGGAAAGPDLLPGGGRPAGNGWFVRTADGGLQACGRHLLVRPGAAGHAIATFEPRAQHALRQRIQAQQQSFLGPAAAMAAASRIHGMAGAPPPDVASAGPDAADALRRGHWNLHVTAKCGRAADDDGAADQNAPLRARRRSAREKREEERQTRWQACYVVFGVEARDPSRFLCVVMDGCAREWRLESHGGKLGGGGGGVRQLAAPVPDPKLRPNRFASMLLQVRGGAVSLDAHGSRHGRAIFTGVRVPPAALAGAGACGVGVAALRAAWVLKPVVMLQSTFLD